MEIHKVSPKIGAELRGIDLRKLDDATVAEIYQAFLDHIVIVIRDQALTEQDFINFSAQFGELKPHGAKSAHHPKHPELLLMDNRIVDTRKPDELKTASPLLVKIGAVWHTDTSYEYITAKATGMYSVNVPSTGGDTLFSNSYMACDTLPRELLQKIEGKSASYLYGGRLKRQQERIEAEDRNRTPAIHPLIQTHPETGRKSLYFNDGQILTIPGMSKDDSDATIAALAQHTTFPDGDYRHRWRAGDVVLWDNRCSIHCATGDYPVHERRTNWRSTIMDPEWERLAMRGMARAAVGARGIL